MATLASKPVTWFKLAPQVRVHFDEGELRALGHSLKVKQLQPVLAQSDGTLIAGERRLRAAQMVGLTELMAVISDEPMTESQLRVFQLTENVHRSDLTEAEKWHACEELLRLNPGWSHKDLASHLKLTEGTVTKYLAPGKAIAAVQQALEAGEIGITTVYEIARAAPEKQAELLALQRSGVSRDGLANRVRKARRSGLDQVRLKRILCPLASGVSITVSGAALSLDDFIESLAEAQKEARKAREQSLDAKTFSAVMRDKAKQGGGR